MAAVSSSPPIHHQQSSPRDQRRERDAKPVPLALSESENKPAIRRGPSSPVMVNFQTEAAYQPFNANIENARPGSQEIKMQKARSRDMPQSPTVVISPTSEDRREDDFESASPKSRIHDHGISAESDGTSSKAASAESSATSASSISGVGENADQHLSEDCSPDESVVEEQVQGFQYHHLQQYPARVSSVPNASDPRSSSQPDLLGGSGSRLTPNVQSRRTSLNRPQSTYSVSDQGQRRSPGPGSNPRTPSMSSRRSPEVRPTSYAELLNVPYPQPAPAPMSIDNSDLRNIVGSNVSLLSTQQTLDMYRQNVRKTNDASIQYSFAVFLISTAQDQGIDWDEKKSSARRSREDMSGSPSNNAIELVKEARSLLHKLASNSYPFAQYYLADGYASGLFNKGKEDYSQAFPLFVLAAKHGHAESAYRTALCYEFGAGCRKDPARAVQFLRSAASKGHPGAMTRLGQACLSGDLGEKRYREGVKWMKLATEAADAMYNTAPYQLACMYETGYGDDIFKDESYAAELLTQAADLGHSEASYRMGDAYEHGKLNCPKDPALSIHFYTGAAERGHAGAMFGLCAWYMVGATPLLEQDMEEAYEWARKSAELGYVKAQFAVGHFKEQGIGCRRDVLEANVWYVKAADSGDERAKKRLATIQAATSGGGVPMEVIPPRGGKIRKGEKGDDGQCIVM